jgi:hypothetical protein
MAARRVGVDVTGRPPERERPRQAQAARRPRLIVMDAGLVQAVGTHAELVNSNPLYAELAATQFLALGA